ncbi:Ribosome maturation factor RimM [Zea mays]|uniref:Ribosome maturation factor RimM n=2 Tax=Zea mays TaxID=4577 RepID=A0A3L6G1M7_MAIZE|nr:Ribosome maturation factor RimM [Zea mays]
MQHNQVMKHELYISFQVPSSVTLNILSNVWRPRSLGLPAARRSVMAQDDPVVSAQWLHEHLVMPDVKPGTRWLRARVAGKQQVREFELVRGRAHTGKKSWIVSFDGVNNLDEARQIVGSAVLVKARDRPEIEDDEFYSLDLYCQVTEISPQDTGKLVGTVGQGFNFGGGDLLQVIMGSSEGTTVDLDSENQDSISSREHVWTPFAEDIVPDVDMASREMRITPPKGLLELNSRSDKRSKKERHAMVRSASSFSSIHARIYSHDLHLKRNKECVRSIVLKC